jgi:glutamyl-tRNA reductase
MSRTIPVSVQIVVVGLNHRSAPLDVRERLAFVPDALGAALERLRSVVAEGFILSTCNRVEVYGLVGHAETGTDALRAFLLEGREQSANDGGDCVYAYSHDDAVRHLFRVAAGMDSMVLGESEIAGQLRRALDDAQEHEALGPTLTRLGAAAIHAGRQVRTRTAIGRNPLSLVSLAMRAAADHEVDAADSAVVVLGAGETAESVLRHLARDMPRDVAIASRSAEHATEVGRLYGARTVEWIDRARAVAAADLVVACTSASEPVLVADDFRERARPVLCVDLGVPRDVDPAARSVPGVSVIDVDELEALAAEHRARRRGEVSHAEGVLELEVEKFMEWRRARQVTPTIVELRAYADQIRDGELDRALARLNGLGPAEQQVVRAMAERIVGRMLHRPLSMLKGDAEGDNMARALRRLFQLDIPT